MYIYIYTLVVTCWTMTINVIQMYGKSTSWTINRSGYNGIRGHDGSLPLLQGDIGEVVRLKENGKIYIQWPKCLCSFWPSSLKLLPFQRRDLVHWASADDDIPTGSIGRVRGIKYSDGGSRLYVNFPKGAWAFSPGCLDAEPNVSGWCHSSNRNL